MKLTKIIPSTLFKSKKSRSVSRSNSDQSTFSFSSSSDAGLTTPTTVLPSDRSEIFDFDLKQAFAMIDRDGDGKIRKEELQALLSRLGAGEPTNEEEMKVMLSEVDRDGDGCITLDEFYTIGSAFAPPACDAEMRETFDFFDSDRDGRITAEELFRVFETIGGDARCTLEDCRRMITGVDRNGDGFVCFDDFRRMMELQQR